MSSLVNATNCQMNAQDQLKQPSIASSLLFGDNSNSRAFSSPNSSSNCSPPICRSPKSGSSDMFQGMANLNKESLSPPITSNSSLSPSIPQPLIAPNGGPTNSNIEQIRLQQLYTLALADRMRLFHPLLSNPYAANNHGLPPPIAPPSPTVPPPPPPQAMAHLSHLAAAAIAASNGSPSRLSMPPQPQSLPSAHPPTDFSPHHLAAYYGKFDPRMFRIPDEPKPQHSYIGLISMAILSGSEKKLVLADIYQYILDNYTYFRHRGPGWRNSIRHNLSLNDCFIKAGRAANGKGHYWAIHPACLEDFKRGDYRRRKAQRKVRRHMGLQVDEEDSPSPPPPPIPSPIGSVLPLGWPTVTPAGVRIPPPILPPPLHHHLSGTGPPPAPIPLPASLFSQNQNIFQPGHATPSAPTGSSSFEAHKNRGSFDSIVASENDRKLTEKSFIDVEDDEKLDKGKSLIESMRASPLSDISHSQTPSINTNKRQFDVASLLGHHNQRSKDPAVAAAAAAISSALTQRFSEVKEQSGVVANTRFEDDIRQEKRSRREIIEDDDDYEGNNSDDSIDDACSFPKLPRLQNYKDGTAAPGIGHRSFFSPIRETQNTPSSDIDEPNTKNIHESTIQKKSSESIVVSDTKDNKDDKNSSDEGRSFDDEPIHSESHKRISGKISTQELCKDSPSTVSTKHASEDEHASKDKEMNPLRSPFSIMQAASAQSFNNNLLLQESQNSSLNPTVSPHEYLARYYQMMQQHQQQSAAGLNGSTLPSSRHHH